MYTVLSKKPTHMKASGHQAVPMNSAKVGCNKDRGIFLRPTLLLM